MVLILSSVFVILVVAHFVLFSQLKSYLRKSHPTEWKEYSSSFINKFLFFDRDIINLGFGYFLLFVQNHSSLLNDQKISKQVKFLQWMHGITALIAIATLILIISTRALA
jgi:hypothetical protein